MERRDSYSLHRVFGLTETGAWVTVVDGLAEALALALDELDGLPPGISVRASPSTLACSAIEANCNGLTTPTAQTGALDERV